MESKYYAIRNKNMAEALVYLSGQSYYKFDDGDKKIYSFERTEVFLKAKDELIKLKNKIHNK